MAYDFDASPSSSPATATDPGLRAFLGRVYLKLAGGLLLSGAIAWSVADVPALRDLFFQSAEGNVTGFTAWGLVLVFSPLAVLFAGSFLVRDHTARGAAWIYWTVAALVGGSLSLLALTYTGAALVSTFLGTAGAFAGLSLVGYLTKRNLAAFGNFLTVALMGLILATVANMFFKNPMAYLVLNGIGVLIFAGLIAADTQRLRNIYYTTQDPEALEASANYGALTLYLNFINLFELLLSFSGGRRRR